MTDAPVWAVVPAKAFERGKSRLEPVLEDPARVAFARNLFIHVTGELHRSRRIGRVLVVTDDATVARTARELGCDVIADPPERRGLAHVVDTGLKYAHDHGATAAFVCMADLPKLTAAAVDRVLGELDSHDVVVVPDLVDEGTNVLALTPPLRMASCFGNVDSFERHQRRAREQGLRLAVRRPSALCFDVDGPDDLRELAQPESGARLR